MNQEYKYVAFRSRKTGNFFEFNEYTTDGYGKYEDTVDLQYGETPTLVFKRDWDARVTQHRRFHPETQDNELCRVMVYSFKDHELNEVEVVQISLMVQE